MQLLVSFLTAFLLFDSLRLPLPANGITCYTYDSNNKFESVRLARDCTECKKVYLMFNISAGVVPAEVTERWQCETNTNTALCPYQESTATSFYADGTAETRLCTCCRDFCNGARDFCNSRHYLVQKIKSLITPYRLDNKYPPKLPPKLICYNGSANLSKPRLFNGCDECRKTVIRNSDGEIQQNWECVNYPPNSWKRCSPFVSATVSADGESSVQASCTCCGDACNTNPSFCMLFPPPPSSNVKQFSAKSVGPTKMMTTTAKITMSSVLAIALLAVIGNRLYYTFVKK